MFFDNDDKSQKKYLKVKSFYKVYINKTIAGLSIPIPNLPFPEETTFTPNSFHFHFHLVFTTIFLQDKIKFVKRQTIGITTYHRVY